MEIKRFDKEKDLKKLEDYLRKEYLDNKNMTSWLPERLHDLVYRMDTQYTDEGKEESSNYIFIWEDNNEIVGCILPDGDAIYISVKKGYENLYKSIVNYAEENCKPLFEKEENGTINFLVIANDSLNYRKEYLESIGYVRDKKEDYDNYVYPLKMNVTVDLPEGFKLMYGDEYTDEVNKWSACHMGFHPELENTNFRNDMKAYNERKKSSMYKDSFECLIIDENTDDINDVCSYSFVYVDKDSKTAFVEPVSTRKPYQGRGFGKAMMHGIILKCKELGIEKCYVNSYDWRRKFYNASGFTTEDTLGQYHKKIR